MKKPIKIAHIINPVMVDKSSDLYVAQPITFETMLTARKFCSSAIEVIQLTAQHKEDRHLIPQEFVITRDLGRSVLDLKYFKIPRKLPLIKDILDRLYNQSNAKFLIYSNVDIALQPYFYQTVSEIIKQGYDAFVINRRSIPGHYSTSTEISLMYAEIGKKHPGFDCFVFHRNLYKKLDLGQICIGTTKIGVTLISNFICKAKKFKLFEDLHLTFHIGEVREWQDERYNDYTEHNEKEALQILLNLKKKHQELFEGSDLCQKYFKVLRGKYSYNKKA